MSKEVRSWKREAMEKQDAKSWKLVAGSGKCAGRSAQS